MNKQKNLANLAKEELLRKIEQVSSLSSYCEKPAEGWIRTTRTALNMSAVELGKRINSRTAEGVFKLEEDEIQGKFIPKHLQNIGKIFGGRFEYVLIPESMLNIKEENILKKAEKNTPHVKKTNLLSEPFLSTSPLPPMPLKGWVYTLRYSLKITRLKLQEKLNISRAHTLKIEDMEKSGKLINKMLRRAAHILGYRIEYVFIPSENLHHKTSLKNSSLLKTLQLLPLLPQKPIEGWICSIRNSQGLTRAEFAERLKITERQVLHLEKNEAKHGLTFTSQDINLNLNELATALGCKFNYVFIKDAPLYGETTLNKYKFMVPFPPKPQKGWIFQIRKAQEMSQIELTKRLNLKSNGAFTLEIQEAHTNPISKSAQEVISALQCRLEYVFIPQNFETAEIHPDYASLFEELKRLSSLPQRQNKGWIYWLRCSLKMTQAELAERIGVTYSQLSEIEWREAHNQLIDRRIMKAVKALGCYLDYRIVPHAVPQRISTLKQDSNNALFSENLSKLSLLPPRPGEGWIRALRTIMGLTRKHLAKKVNCDATNVSHLEDHEKQFLIPHNFLVKAARCLGCRTELVFIPEDIIHFTNVISSSTPLIKTINVRTSPNSQKSSEYDQDFLEKFKVFSLLPSPPEEGWIRTLRKALRIFHNPEITESMKIKFRQVENNEIKNKLYSQSTKAIAKALKCRIEYFLIPENPFGEERSLYKKEFLEQLLSLPIRSSQGWIYTMRKALKLSQKDLAQRISLYPCHISYKENEERKENLIYKAPKQIAQLLGYRLEYFFVPECIFN